MELFDFFHGSYKKTSTEKLLEFMKNSSDLEALKKLSPEELLITYCERLGYSIINDNLKSTTQQANV